MVFPYSHYNNKMNANSTETEAKTSKSPDGQIHPYISSVSPARIFHTRDEESAASPAGHRLVDPTA